MVQEDTRVYSAVSERALGHAEPAIRALRRPGGEGRQAGRAGRLRGLRVDDDPIGGFHRRALLGVEIVEPLIVKQLHRALGVVARDREP